MRAVTRVLEREELRARLEGVRSRLGGGVGRLTVEEWREWGDELLAASRVVREAVAKSRLDVAWRERLAGSWESLVVMLEEKVLPGVDEESPPSLTQEFRV